MRKHRGMNWDACNSTGWQRQTEFVLRRPLSAWRAFWLPSPHLHSRYFNRWGSLASHCDCAVSVSENTQPLRSDALIAASFKWQTIGPNYIWNPHVETHARWSHTACPYSVRPTDIKLNIWLSGTPELHPYSISQLNSRVNTPYWISCTSKNTTTVMWDHHLIDSNTAHVYWHLYMSRVAPERCEVRQWSNEESHSLCFKDSVSSLWPLNLYRFSLFGYHIFPFLFTFYYLVWFKFKVFWVFFLHSHIRSPICWYRRFRKCM